MYRGDFSLLLSRIDAVGDNADRHRSHNFHGLTDCGQGGRVQTGNGHVIEADDRTVFRNPQAGFRQRPYCSKRGHIVKGHQGGNNSFATAGSFPDVVGNPSVGIPKLPPGNSPLVYNPAAFVAPTGLTFGDAGRNNLRNPWRTNFDMALLKHIAVTESKYFECRAEAFNVFNHREYAWLGSDAGSAADNANGSGVTDGKLRRLLRRKQQFSGRSELLRKRAPSAQCSAQPTHPAASAEVYFLIECAKLFLRPGLP